MARILHINGSIDLENTNKIMMELQGIIDNDNLIIEENKKRSKTNQIPLEEVVINITTGGGGTYYGCAILDMLDEVKAPISTHGRGFVMSMGFIIFLKGQKRTCGENCYFMNHSSSGEWWGYTENAKCDLEHSMRLDDMFDELILQETRLSKEDLEQGKLKCMYFNKDEAKLQNIINS